MRVRKSVFIVFLGRIQPDRRRPETAGGVPAPADGLGDGRRHRRREAGRRPRFRATPAAAASSVRRNPAGVGAAARPSDLPRGGLVRRRLGRQRQDRGRIDAGLAQRRGVHRQRLPLLLKGGGRLFHHGAQGRGLFRVRLAGPAGRPPGRPAGRRRPPSRSQGRDGRRDHAEQVVAAASGGAAAGVPSPGPGRRRRPASSRGLNSGASRQRR